MHSEIANPGIVVGIDGSPDSGAALQWAVREATMRNVALTLVHAATPVPGDSLVLKWTGDSVPAELLGALGATAQQALADAVKLVEDMTDDRSRPRINNEDWSIAPTVRWR
jgi:nucleotide-binding universal stress UspA family protein